MRKKLFAVIMSAMMMITFMPTMAFAATADATGGSWNYNHTEYTPTGSTTPIKKVARTMLTTGTVGTDDIGKFTVAAYTDAGVKIPESEETYYDLSKFVVRSFDASSTADDKLKGDSVSYADALAKNLFASTTNTEITVWGWFDAAGITDYVTTLTNDWTALSYPTNKPVSVQTNLIEGVQIKMDAFEYDADNKFADQTLGLDIAPASALGDTINVQGVWPTKTLTVKAKTEVEANDAEYLIDGKKAVEFGTGYVATGLTNIYYDGAEHSIAQKELTGVTSTVEVYNSKTGAFETTANATFKNVGDYKFKFTPAKGENKGATRIVNFSVQAQTVKFVFNSLKKGYYITDQGLVDTDTSAAIVVEKGFDPVKYVGVDGNSPADEKAVAAAIKANKDALMEYFNAYYEVKTEPNAQDENIIGAKIQTKEDLSLTYAEKQANLAKYKELLTNFGVTGLNISAMAEGKITGNDTQAFVIDNENSIVWKTAPLTKTYKAKNGKLPKNKTFKIKATSSAKTPVTYRLTKGGSMIKINKTTGKVTVKKGLKKGTYKVNVYAQAKYSTKYSAYANDSYTLKIKVK